MAALFISADMEGCAGVASQDALGPDRFEWTAARRWMTAEVSAAARAALAAGYDRVVIADGHGTAQNILPDELPARCWLVRSWPRPLLQMQGVEEPDVDACLFIGYHGGATYPGALLAHTYSGAAFRDLRLNGISASEGYLNAALAAEYGRPVLLVTGDAAANDDAERYAPQAVRCILKHAFGVRSAASMSPAEACDRITEATRAALAMPRPAPMRITPPYRLELDMTSQVAAEMLAYLPATERVNSHTVAVNCPTLAQAMQWVSFAIVYNPKGVIQI